MNKKPENEAELKEALQHWKDNPPKPRKSYKKPEKDSKKTE